MLFRAEWNYVLMASGVQCVIAHGLRLMHLLFVDNLDYTPQVRQKTAALMLTVTIIVVICRSHC